MKILIIFLLTIPFDSNSSIRALNIAATGMASQEENVSNISNNIANVNTVGFKKNRAEFEDLTYYTAQEAGSRSSGDSKYSVGIQYGTGSKISGIKKDFTIGTPNITNNPFDLMIQGDGFFGILLADNTIKYTRDGSFSVNRNGTLVTKKGFIVFPTINIPPGTINVKISSSGTVEAYLKNQIEAINIGTIPLFTFNNPPGLKSVGGNLYQITQTSGPPIQQLGGQNNAGEIMQGALESSNVSIMNEMTDLIKAQRSYEMNSKVMTIADQMLQTINNIR